MFRKYFLDWKVHLLCLGIFVVAEFIGAQPVGPVRVFGANLGFTVFPLLFSLLIGAALGLMKLISRQSMEIAAPYISIAVVWLIAKLASGIGPNLPALIAAGPAFFLQELGNLGSVFLSITAAVLIFRMGREAIGAGFSISREPSLALVSSMYGLDSPEGRGLMGAYITGTVLGTVFFGIFASILVTVNIFSYQAMALAAGMGSASMMVAALAPMLDAWPHLTGEIMALASTSNLLTAGTGLYFNMLIAIPTANWLYKKLKGEERYKKAVLKKAQKNGLSAEDVETAFRKRAEQEAQEKASFQTQAAASTNFDRWFSRGKVLLISGIFVLFSNFILTMGAMRGMLHLFRTGEYLNPAAVVYPLQAIPGMLFFAVPIILGFLLDDLVSSRFKKIKIPAIFYISLIGIIMGIPGFPLSELYIAATNKVSLLSIGTVVLAYGGISLCKDIKAFKGQGLGIVIVALLAFSGSYLGSAIIADIVFRIMGVI